MMESEIAERLSRLEQLERENSDLKESLQINNAAASILTDLLNKGDAVYNEDGSISVPNGNTSKKKDK